MTSSSANETSPLLGNAPSPTNSTASSACFSPPSRAARFSERLQFKHTDESPETVEPARSLIRGTAIGAATTFTVYMLASSGVCHSCGTENPSALIKGSEHGSSLVSPISTHATHVGGGASLRARDGVPSLNTSADTDTGGSGIDAPALEYDADGVPVSSPSESEHRHVVTVPVSVSQADEDG